MSDDKETSVGSSNWAVIAPVIGLLSSVINLLRDWLNRRSNAQPSSKLPSPVPQQPPSRKGRRRKK